MQREPSPDRSASRNAGFLVEIPWAAFRDRPVSKDLAAVASLTSNRHDVNPDLQCISRDRLHGWIHRLMAKILFVVSFASSRNFGSTFSNGPRRYPTQRFVSETAPCAGSAFPRRSRPHQLDDGMALPYERFDQTRAHESR